MYVHVCMHVWVRVCVLIWTVSMGKKFNILKPGICNCYFGILLHASLSTAERGGEAGGLCGLAAAQFTGAAGR